MLRFAKFLLATFLFMSPFSAFASEAEVPFIAMEVGNDFYSAGAVVEVSERVAGDVYLGGAVVSVTADIIDDLVVGGSSVTISSKIGDDLRAIGSLVTLTGVVDSNAVIVGGVINILPGSRIEKDVIIAGGVVNFGGTAVGNLKIFADEVYFSGTVERDVTIRANKKVMFSKNAKINGELNYSAPYEVEIFPELANIVNFKLLEKSDTLTFNRKTKGVIGFSVAILVVGVILLTLFGTQTAVYAGNIRQNFWNALFVGVVLFLVPIVAILLLATGIGALLAAVLMFVWLTILIMAGALSAFGIGSFFLRQKKKTTFSKKLLALIIGLVVIALIGFIPQFGILIQIVIFTVSLGALVLTKFQLYKAMKKAKLL